MAASIFEEFSNLCSAANSCPLLNFHRTRERCFCLVWNVEQRSPQEESRKELHDRPLRNRLHSPYSLCGSVVEYQRAGSEVLRFDSSWRLRTFSLSQVCDKTENIFLYFFIKLKTNHLSYSISIELADQ